MQSDVAITINGLGKRYRIGEKRAPYRTVREEVMSLLGRAVAPRRWRRELSSHRAHIWALRDLSLSIRQGEAVGIIGRNGSGKSTLLKVLSRVTGPTEGEVRIRGRVGSLLEVGTGFHPELTGRENIYLNGAILGMRRNEIVECFDDIVAFAEVEQFLDTPVKRYSSGMFVRLAFAVAAHLRTEILIVDEVLAVGDVAFQRRCLERMGQLASEGRTVLFVSHGMAAVQRLCGTALLLADGRLEAYGVTADVVRAYLAASPVEVAASVDLRAIEEGRRGSGRARFVHVELLALDGRRSSSFLFGEPFRVRLTAESRVPLKDVVLGFSFVTRDGVELQGTAAHDGGVGGDLPAGRHTLECVVDPMVLTPGQYTIRAAMFRTEEVFDHIDSLTSFTVEHASAEIHSTPSSHWVGHVYLPYRWRRFTDTDG